ncbi:MAG TPA: hypothetical protein VFI62_03490 [Burkholderiales bacterium]|nr:hypothetical protein [Burkholderiales bacterium]
MALTSGQGRQDTPAQVRDLDSKLDEAIAESFPASDPVALSMPHDAEEMGRASVVSPTSMMLISGGLLALIAFIALRR